MSAKKNVNLPVGFLLTLKDFQPKVFLEEDRESVEVLTKFGKYQSEKLYREEYVKALEARIADLETTFESCEVVNQIPNGPEIGHYLKVDGFITPELIQKIKNNVSVLQYLSSFEDNDIDSPTLDVRFEHDGVDTGCEVSIVEQFTEDMKLIVSLATLLGIKLR